MSCRNTRCIWGRWIHAIVVGVVLCSWALLAHASTAVYVLAIGYNGAPLSEARGEAADAPLQYADDDAVAFYQFAREFSREGRLLTIMDADTQARFPAEVAKARPPTLSQLRGEVRELRQLLDHDRQRGEESVVLFFYSGHGNRPTGAPAALTLLDGSLTHDMLYDEVLTALPATYVHVFIDACYAEAIVRPRDRDAAAVDLSESDFAHYAASSTLARFPNVGAVVASSTSSQTHEWDVYRHGVFSHELLSGLRGAADVNVDNKVEYSELYAFLTAANRAVTDTRAKLSVVARPPGVNARAAIIDATEMRAFARIEGIPASAGELYLEDQFGNRLADVRVESGAKLALMVPADRSVFLRCRNGEAEFVLHADQRFPFDQLTMRPPAARMRGVLDLAMRKGLFSTGFGPNYYRGFIDQTSGFVSVSLPDTDAPGQPFDRVNAQSTSPATRMVSLFAAGGVTESVGRGLGMMPAVRIGLRPVAPSGFTLSVDGAWGQSAFAEGRVLGSVGYRLGARRGKAIIFAGIAVGGGVASQSVPATVSQASPGGTWAGAVLVGPSVGVSYQLVNRMAVGTEVSFDTLFYRRDGDLTVSALPAAYAGLALDL